MIQKIVITYGTFDLFHVGHVKLLERLSHLGDKLYVGLSSDEFNEIKGKKTVISYEDRKTVLESCKYVDFVFKEECWEQKLADIKKFKANIFAMGDDWSGTFDSLSTECEVLYLSRTKDISSTSLKSVLSSFDEKKKQELYNQTKKLEKLVGEL
ncbi:MULTISPECIES: adenylyltransferase/cytidyltransferase family protein [unclassified Vibrio]|uniref:adenylyltransferase/cytidyltransferase family protein n=1 Tax=unclassified Vibrio TaxID=2614977 RepID=UPI000CB797D7|nr:MULTISPECIES: adenylyltransferase/cytidyltransferase family protein [unclassified Vibrio]PMK18709.1 glycerol-3-phosphate cytidylyltransferase [Vibrio sp. 10N.261.54.C3]TKF38450.1 glycerol-3-phosphate cytidylyltransferase [Vibrio sp. F13]